MMYETMAGRGPGSGDARTLVMYVYYEADAVARENLEFFLKVGVGQKADPLIDYLLIVNGDCSLPLTGLPPNVRVFKRENACYDGGSAGEVLKKVDSSGYRFFMILNSSVRGPFLPRHWPPGLPWTSAFTSLITDTVKLVGTTISCEEQVHVQSMVLATDTVGMRVLLKEGALDCAQDRADAIKRFELGSSTTIMKHGYSIDCLMLRYRGVDWRRQKSCNMGANPSFALGSDGLPTNPLELVFVKAKPLILASDLVLRRYTDYALGRDNVATNAVYSEEVQWLLQSRRERLARFVADCHAEFDFDYWLSKYPDFAVFTDRNAMYKQIVDEEIWHGHEYRYHVPYENAEDAPHAYCKPFVDYKAPNLAG